MTKLYLAGPLFTAAEQCFNADLARFLEREGFEVWLPQEHEPRRVKAQKRPKAIFAMAVAALDAADMVIACMDGPDPDSGTAWECGYAYAKGKPIVCYRTDFRMASDTKDAPYNLMLSASATSRVELPFRTTPRQFHRRLLAQIRKALRPRQACASGALTEALRFRALRRQRLPNLHQQALVKLPRRRPECHLDTRCRAGAEH